MLLPSEATYCDQITGNPAVQGSSTTPIPRANRAVAATSARGAPLRSKSDRPCRAIRPWKRCGTVRENPTLKAKKSLRLTNPIATASTATAIRTATSSAAAAKTRSSPSMNSPYTAAVTARKTMPTRRVRPREPVRTIRPIRKVSTHSEQGLKPSTTAMAAVTAKAGRAAKEIAPNQGRSIPSPTPPEVAEPVGEPAVPAALSCSTAAVI